MMLYEAVHFQRQEHYYDYSSKMREAAVPKPPKVQRNRSASIVPRQTGVHAPISRTASFVVGQKLRESKWFTHEELKIFAAVVETGFIVQRKDEEDGIEFGVAVWNVGQEKSKDQNQLKIYTVQLVKDAYKVACLELLAFWPENTRLRIYNQSDKTDLPHSEEIIRDQIANAESAKLKWHGSEHFTYWCRYGPVHLNQRIRNMTDAKWGNFGLNGLLLIKKRIRRMTSNSNK